MSRRPSGIVESIVVDVPVRTAYDQWTQFEELPLFPLEPVPGSSCRVSLDLHDSTPGRIKAIGGLLGIVRERVTGELERFKHFLEARATATGGFRGSIPAAPAQPS